MSSSPRQKGASPASETPDPSPLTPVEAEAGTLSVRLNRRYLQIAFGLAALLIGLMVIYLLRDFLGAFVLGASLAFLVQPAVRRLHGRGLPRAVAILLIFLAVLVAVGGLVVLVVPLVVNEFGQLQGQVPKLAAGAQDKLNSLQGSPIQFMGLKLDVATAIDSISKNANGYLLGQFGNALSLGLAALGTLLQIVLMFIVAFLFALDAAAIQRQMRRVVPQDYRHDFDLIWRKVRKMLYAYVRGQLVIAAMIGVLSGIVCAVLGLPNAIALGLLAGITAVIPYFGPFVGAVPAILVGLAVSPLKALEVGVAYFVIPNIILNFIYPKIVGDAVRLPPVLVIIALIAGFSLAGILGMFVAVPVAATLRILFDHIYPRLYESRA